MGYDLKYTDVPVKGSDLLNLYEKLGWNDYLKLSAENLAKAMEVSLVCIFVYDRELLVGTGRVISDGVINAYICGVGVLQEYRGMGIAREIIRRLKEQCINAKLHIQLICEDNLVPMYRKMGFEEFAVAMRPGEDI